jgi:hypothetical protein
MEEKKQEALEKAGWKFGDVEDFLNLSPEALRASVSTGGAAFGPPDASIDQLAYHVIVFLNDDAPRVSSFSSITKLKQYLARLLKAHAEDELYVWPFYGTLLRISEEEPRRLVAPDFSKALVIDDEETDTESADCEDLPLVPLSDGFVGPEWFRGADVADVDEEADEDDD